MRGSGQTVPMKSIGGRFLSLILLASLFASVNVAPTYAAAPNAPGFAQSKLEVVVDNDLAVFYGDATNANELLYQSNLDWSHQISDAGPIDIVGSDTRTYVYIVAMGGGGTEDFGGKLNGQNITTISGAQFASTASHTSTFGGGSKTNSYLEIQGSLSGYNSSAAAAGTYNVALSDLRTALTGAAWSSAVATGSGNGIPPLYKTSGVCCSGGTAGWDIPSDHAVVFRYPIASLGTPVTAGNKQVSVTWSNPSGGVTPTSFVVEYMKTNDPSDTFTVFSTPAYGTNTETVTGLTNGVNYSFRVAARNGAEQSAYTAVRTATPVGPPSAPRSVTGSPDSGTATVSFTTPASDGGSSITNYQYSTNDGSTWTSFSPVTTSSPVTISGLTNGTTYQIRIRAINAIGNGDSSTAVSVTPGTPFLITYNSQGGSSIGSETTTAGSSINVSPGTPTYSGFTFNGWFTAASGGSQLAFPYAHGQSSAFSLYAHWTAVVPVAIPDPPQRSSITSYEEIPNGNGKFSFKIYGIFASRVVNVSVDGSNISSGIWDQNSQTILIRGEYLPGQRIRVQLYNGQVPLLQEISYTFSSIQQQPSPAPSPTAKPTAKPTPAATISPTPTPTVTASPQPSAKSTVSKDLGTAIGFAFGVAQITSASAIALQGIGAPQGSKIAVYGFASKDSPKFDPYIAQMRADTVKKLLLAIDPTLNIVAIGKGSTPNNLCSSFLNRCAVVKVLS